MTSSEKFNSDYITYFFILVTFQKSNFVVLASKLFNFEQKAAEESDRCRNSKIVFFILGTIGGFSALIYWIILLGGKLEQGRDIVISQSDKSQWQEFVDAFMHNLQHPLAILLAQVVTIILVARIFGWICTKIGQPTVIGEMIAGIVLGPSLVGMYFPEFSAVLFPAQSLGNLQFLSQVGLILFMYIVGMELDLTALRSKAHDAVVVSHASIIIPFALGRGIILFPI